jgi:hypothetical protein
MNELALAVFLDEGTMARDSPFLRFTFEVSSLKFVH